MQMKRFLVLFFLCISYCAFSQTFDECVEYVKNNKYADAIKGLEALQKADDNKMAATLLLAYLEVNREDYIPAFRNFKIFYENLHNPTPFLYGFSGSGIFNVSKGISGNDAKNFLEQILVDSSVDMSVKFLTTDLLAKFYSSTGDFIAVKHLYEYVGELKNWSTVGAFENVSGCGFNRIFGVLEHPEADHVFISKNGAEVKWVGVVALRNDHWCDFEHIYEIDNSVVYAQTFVTVDSDMDVQIKIGASGSLKVWINDYIVAQESEERSTMPDVYGYKVKLQKGVNRVLVQTGSSEVDRNNFIVRFFSLEGQLLDSLQSDPGYKPYTKAKPYEVKTIPFYPASFFENYLSAHKDDIMSKILLLNIYNRNGNKFAAHKILSQLKKDAPHCTLFSELAINTARIDKNVIEESREKESIKTYDPESIQGLSYLYEDAMNKEKWDNAITIVRKQVALFGADINTDIRLINALVKKNDNEGIVKQTNETYNKYPNSAEIAMFKYLLIQNGSKSIKVAKDFLLRFLISNYDNRVAEIVIEDDFKTGEKEEGKKWFRKLIENNPQASILYAKYAMALYEMHDYKEAYDMIDKAIAIAPYAGWNYYVKGLIYNANGEKKKAIEMLQKSVVYSPTDYKARRKLRELQEKKDLSDYFKENNIMEIYKTGRENNAYEKEMAVCLLNDKREIVYPEQGAVVEENEMLYLIKSQSAIDNFKEFNIPYNSYAQRLVVDKVEILKKDGSKVEAEKQKGHCVFSTIEVGDAIHLSYKLEDSYEGKLAEHFWDNFYFNSYSYPVQTARYSLIVPASKKFDYKVLNTVLEPVIKDVDEYRLFEWEKKDLPKIDIEQPVSFDVFEQLIISSIPDWDYVANWYSGISNTKTTSDFEIKEKVAELISGKEGLSDFEKAKIIYNYIEQNFHYSNVAFLHSAYTPQRASRTLNAKLGDCKDLATLFVSMAKEAGLDANLVLVNSRGNYENQMVLPGIGFNHCIAQLHCNNTNYMIELTNNDLPFTAMNFTIINAQALSIPKNGEEIKKTSLNKLNSNSKLVNINFRTADISFNNNKAIINRHVVKVGSESANARYYYKTLSESERFKVLKEDIGKEFNKDVKIDKIDISGMNILSDTVNFDYSFSVDNYVSEIIGMKVIKIPWTESYAYLSLFSPETRKTPLDLWYLTATPVCKEIITVLIPSGNKLAELPKDISLSCSSFTYSVKFKINGNKLIASRELRYLKDRITPQEYPEAKKFITKMVQSDSKEIVFKLSKI